MRFEADTGATYITQPFPVPIVHFAMGVPQEKLDVLLVRKFEISEDEGVARGSVS